MYISEYLHLFIEDLNLVFQLIHNAHTYVKIFNFGQHVIHKVEKFLIKNISAVLFL